LRDGYRTRLADGRSFGEALLDPTVLYAPVIEKVFAAGVRPHYAVNITGHGWRKLMRHRSDLRYVVRQIPPVPPVLELIQKEGGMSARDAYGSLNMGAGFALFVAPADVSATLRAAAAAGVVASHAGEVRTGTKSLVIEPLGLEYSGSDLHVRA
jgi:phosphoribosylformylglycinamidine cyclo-ligase